MTRPCWLITRPRPDAEALAARLADAGHDALIAPVLTIRAHRNADLDLDGVGTIVFTSANGVRAFAARCDRRDLRVLAVAGSTADAARAAGFHTPIDGGGTVDRLGATIIDRLIPADGALLHVRGRHAAGDLSGRLSRAGFDVRSAVLYTAEPVRALDPAAASALRDGTITGVLFFSPRTAKLFDIIVRDTGLVSALHTTVAVCLSPNIAAQLDLSLWGGLEVAQTATTASMMDVLHPFGSPHGTPFRPATRPV